jgi:RimJ/RimL family protein N-acetyltransferase
MLTDMLGSGGNVGSTYLLTTERLGFRTWTEDDLDLALGLWGDPEVTRLIDARGKLSEGQVRERLAQEIEGYWSWGFTSAPGTGGRDTRRKQPAP